MKNLIAELVNCHTILLKLKYRGHYHTSQTREKFLRYKELVANAEIDPNNVIFYGISLNIDLFLHRKTNQFFYDEGVEILKISLDNIGVKKLLEKKETPAGKNCLFNSIKSHYYPFFGNDRQRLVYFSERLRWGVDILPLDLSVGDLRDIKRTSTEKNLEVDRHIKAFACEDLAGDLYERLTQEQKETFHSLIISLI